MHSVEPESMDPVDTYQPAEENFVNQGTFLDQLENNLQYRLYVPEQQVYVHKVKVASAHDMCSKTSREQEYSCNQNYGLQTYQTYSSDQQTVINCDQQTRERVSISDSPSNICNKRSKDLIPAGNVYRGTVIFDGTSPAEGNVSDIITDNKVCYEDNSGTSSIIASNNNYGRSCIDTGRKNFKTRHTGVTGSQSFEEMQIKDGEGRNLQTSVSSRPTVCIEEYSYQNADALSSTQSYSNSVPTLDEGLQREPPSRTNNDNSAVTFETICPASSSSSDYGRSMREPDHLQDRAELTGVLSATVDPVHKEQVEYVSELKAADTAQESVSSAGGDSASDISLSSDDSDNSTEVPSDHSTLQETDAVLLEQKSINKTDQRKKGDVQKETKQNTNIYTNQKKEFGDDHGSTAREISEQSQEIGSMSSTTDDQAEFVTVSWFHFKCKFCGKAFQERKIWKMHLINEHGAKPYVCMYCDERFEQKLKLREHHRLHEVGSPKKKVEKTQKPKEPKNKLAIKVSEDSAIEEKRVADKKVAIRGRKRKAITKPLKEQRNPVFLPKSSRKSAKVTKNIENSKQQSAVDDDAVGRNKRKRGPVFRYIPESNKPVRRRRQPVKKFPCEHCTRVFTSNHTKVLHEKSHKCYTCNSCGKMFKLKRLLKKHETTHNIPKKKTNPASIKVKVYCDDDDREETKTDEEEQADEDYVIEEVGEGEEEDSDKEGSEKDEEGPFKCQFCPRMIKKRRNLAKHEKTHENGIPHTCPHCQKVYVRRRDLRRHMVRHTTNKPYQCDKCMKRFKHGVGLRRHMRLHTGEGLLVCQFCGKKYNGKGSLKAHERIHTGEKPYSCQHCDKFFGTQTAQRYHELEHTGGMICHICGRQFKSKHNLQEHERIHSGERPYKCSRCEMSFMSMGARRYHMNVHTGDEHWCEKCHKQFTCKASLDAHKFTHTGLHPYKCKYCSKLFNSISGVRGHEKQVHLGLKRKHKTKSQKVLEKILIVQKKKEVNRTLTKKEFKAISAAAKAATMAEQNGPLKPGRKPRDKNLPKDLDPSAFTSMKTTKLTPDLDFCAKAPVEDYNSATLVTHQKVAHMEKHLSKVLQKMPDVEYPTRVVIGDAEGHNSSSTVTQSVPVDYSATYVSSALQKAIGLIPRGHNNTPHPHATTPWPGQHVGNSHLDTMVESLVQFSKNY